MENKTFHEALRATARVACVAAVVGWAPSAVSAGEASGVVAQAAGPSELAPDLQGHYQAEASAVSAAEGGEKANGQWACTLASMLGLPLPPACTPWGPPVPPRLPSATPTAEA